LSDHFDPTALPIRELPHGNVANLYLLYSAWCRAKTQAVTGRSTFYKTFKAWSCCLLFHKKSTHSICKVCSQLRSKIHESKATWLDVDDFAISICFLFEKKLMGYHYNIILNAICSNRKIAVDKIWGEECLQKGDTLYYNCFGVKPAFCIRTSKLTLLHATICYSTTHSSFVTVKCIGACVNIHGPMKGWLLWS